MTARWRIERCHEKIPALGVEQGDVPIRKSLFGLAEGCFENKFADRLRWAVAAARKVSFAELVRRRSSLAVRFLRWVI
jgi:hypothetical protein